MNEAILVTGGAGFIGSNFVPYFAKKYPRYRIMNLDKLTYAASLEGLHECDKLDNYRLIPGDICDVQHIDLLFMRYDIKGIIHFAAESHVDNSITGPRAFIETNIVGTFNLLEAARKHWMNAPHKYKPGYEDCRFHHISTDEVYGTLGDTGLFTEETPYAPNSPYSASKASSDFLVRSYHHTFGMNVTTSNCSNNYGPKQHVEKLIPTIIKKCLTEQPIPVYGNGKNIRDWLYVLDHCKAIDLIYHTGESGETYNVGGSTEKTNIDIVNEICNILDIKHPRKNGGSYSNLITYVKDRPGHDLRYAIDSSKLQSKLGWKPEENLNTGLIKTIDWYIENLKENNSFT